jgi:hypothetical protein
MHADIETHVATEASLWARRVNRIGWGLLLLLTGSVWLLLPEAAPPGSWLFGVATILVGVSAVRYAIHIDVSGFSVGLALGALAAGISQMWRTDPPVVAIFVMVIGASLMVKPLFSRTA